MLDRFSALSFKVLAMQRDPGFATELKESMAGLTPETPRGMVGGDTGLGIGMGMDTGGKDAGMGLNGTFDALQDMQVDMSGWNFPDFWAFDMGGDF